MRNKEIVIIDYGIGNIFSIRQAVEYNGAKATVTRDKSIIENSSHIILPGVGAFGNAIRLIKDYDLDVSIRIAVEKGNYLLGICLGMQLLLTSSDEFSKNYGLDLIKGEVKKIDHFTEEEIKLPHIGWNSIYLNNDFAASNFRLNIKEKNVFYFIHNYMATPFDKKNINYLANYGKAEIPAIISKDNVFGVRFHPEKSGKNGLNLINNFIQLK